MQERLIIKNFFSIKSFDWDIRDFNILTGGMASGKSLCIKLLSFLEDVLNNTIFHESITKEYLSREEKFFDRIFDRIKERFEYIFQQNGFNYSETEIDYSYSYNNHIFDLHAKYDTNSSKLVWSSDYIKNHLEQWQSYFEKKDTPDMSQIVCKQIYESISRDFADSFPFGTIFIPSLRAITAISDNNDYSDPFLSKFIREIKPFVLQFNSLSTEDINNILHINGMNYNKDKKELKIILPGNRNILPLVLSSGQQELLYFLLVIGHLENPGFILGNRMSIFINRISIFIEEPSAHLFPLEQKETIEFIVKIFRELKDKKNKLHPRFFITTHSPYILNVINTIMNRGRLKIELDKLDNEQEFRDIDLSLYFMKDEISAYFIENDGQVNSMIPEDESCLYGDKIDDISQNIFDEANKIAELLSMIEVRKQK